MSTHLGRIHVALHDFDELLNPSTYKIELENHNLFLMTLALYALPQEYVVQISTLSI